MDPNTQGLMIGTALLDSVNQERKALKQPELEWSDEWFKIAQQYAGSESLRQLQSIQSDQQQTFIEKMNKTLPSMDHVMYTASVSIDHWTPFQEALKMFEGTEDTTSATHGAIGVYLSEN